MTVTLTLPVPPSANRYWRTRVITPRGGKPFVSTYVSEEAEAFKLQVMAVCRERGIRDVVFPAGTPVSLTMTWYRERKSGDLSNRIKVVEDALNGLVWADDKQVAELHVYRVDGQRPGRVEVTIAAIAS